MSHSIATFTLATRIFATLNFITLERLSIDKTLKSLRTLLRILVYIFKLNLESVGTFARNMLCLILGHAQKHSGMFYNGVLLVSLHQFHSLFHFVSDLFHHLRLGSEALQQ